MNKKHQKREKREWSEKLLRPRIDKGRRGRPSGRSVQDYDNLESITLIARKYDLDPKQLVDAFHQAVEKKRAQCGCLEVSCRNIDQDSAIFLITKEEGVVWQFPVNLEMMRNLDVKEYIRNISVPEKKMTEESRKNLKISELRFGMKGINVSAKVVDIAPTQEVTTRWGSQVCVSNVKIADTTGSIKLSLWSKQIETVHIGDEVEINNCSVARFANDLQLRLGRQSTLSVTNPPQ
ncbi:MAG: hypothetical protein V1915_03680 [Candidatus Bathyarchaeota archaeon]